MHLTLTSALVPPVAEDGDGAAGVTHECADERQQRVDVPRRLARREEDNVRIGLERGGASALGSSLPAGSRAHAQWRLGRRLEEVTAEATASASRARSAVAAGSYRTSVRLSGWRSAVGEETIWRSSYLS